MILCLAAAAHPAMAQTKLPSSFAGWNAAGPPTIVPPGGIDNLVGQDAVPFREYIVKSVEQASFTQGAQGAQSASITLYHFRDPSSAYGAYTFLRDDSLSPVDVGAYASASKLRALIVVGEFLAGTVQS